MGRRKIRVFVVDDSPVMRALIQRMLSGHPVIEVAGLAVDAFDAREKLLDAKPDVITLDVDMRPLPWFSGCLKQPLISVRLKEWFSQYGRAGSGAA